MFKMNFYSSSVPSGVHPWSVDTPYIAHQLWEALSEAEVASEPCTAGRCAPRVCHPTQHPHRKLGCGVEAQRPGQPRTAPLISQGREAGAPSWRRVKESTLICTLSGAGSICLITALNARHTAHNALPSTGLNEKSPQQKGEKAK